MLSLPIPQTNLSPEKSLIIWSQLNPKILSEVSRNWEKLQVIQASTGSVYEERKIRFTKELEEFMQFSNFI